MTNAMKVLTDALDRNPANADLIYDAILDAEYAYDAYADNPICALLIHSLTLIDPNEKIALIRAIA